MELSYLNTKEIRSLIEKNIGETRVKTFFSYYAIFKDNTMFGLYKNKKFYLRVPEQLSEKDQSLIDTLNRLDDPKMGIHCKRFYHFTDSVLDQPELYSHLITLVIEEIKQNKINEEEKRKKKLRNLLNFNIRTERLLKRININSIEEFLEKGAYQTFIELIKIGIDANENLLFKLYGAENKQHIYTMSEELKIRILKEADQALYDANLRKRFLNQYKK